MHSTGTVWSIILMVDGDSAKRRCQAKAIQEGCTMGSGLMFVDNERELLTLSRTYAYIHIFDTNINSIAKWQQSIRTTESAMNIAR